MDRRQFAVALLGTGLISGLEPRYLAGQLDQPAISKVATGTRGVVSSVHPLATGAAMAEFKRCGNAIDAAVARR